MSLFTVRFVHEIVDLEDLMTKEILDTLMEHRPKIEFGGHLFDIEYLTYDAETGIFYIHLGKR